MMTSEQVVPGSMLTCSTPRSGLPINLMGSVLVRKSVIVVTYGVQTVSRVRCVVVARSFVLLVGVGSEEVASGAAVILSLPAP